MTKTKTEEADNYIKDLKEEIGGLSDAEKISTLLGKVRYWYGSAVDWRDFYEICKDSRIEK